MKEVTIIVTTWNSLEMFKLFLEYLEKYTPAGYKLIVVNNGSKDGTKEFLDSREDIVSIHNSKNVGVVKALDQAEELVKTKYLVSMNDDILVSRGWLYKLLEVYNSDPKIKTVAPVKPSSKIKYPYSDKTSREEWDNLQVKHQDKISKQAIFQKFVKNDYDRFVKDFKKMCDYRNEELECPFDFVSGCCVLVETVYMKKIGGFSDTRFQIYGAEDVDRCWRIGKDGNKVVRTSEVFVHHFEGASLKKNNLNWKKLVKLNNQILVEKWKEDFWPRLDNKIKEYGSLDAVVEKYWIVGWLLESMNDTSIPLDMRDLVNSHLMSINKN